MIISASRRTDIPAFYSPWFFNRIKEGYVLVPNPFNSKMISKVMIEKLDKLEDYKYYFQFTLNPYGEKLENNLPSVAKRIDIFKRLSDKIGREKVIWRYDPILTNEEFNVSFHKEAFARIADNIKPPAKEEIEEIAVSFRQTMDAYPTLQLDTCTSKVDLRHLNIPAGLCVDKELIERITGYPILAKKDKNQRNICNCIESIDIGTYESCLNGCIYCYAIKGNYNSVEYNMKKHDKHSPLLIANLSEDDVVKERDMKSLRNGQYSLF